jgi:hypothetical protein
MAITRQDILNDKVPKVGAMPMKEMDPKMMTPMMTMNPDRTKGKKKPKKKKGK